MEGPIERNDLSGRVRELEKKDAVTNERVTTLDKEKDLLWDAVHELRKEDKKMDDKIGRTDISQAKSQAVISILQTVAIGLIMYFLTK